MVTRIEIWRTDDGKDFDTEVEALRYENEQLRTELNNLKWHNACQNPEYKEDKNSPKRPPISGFIGSLLDRPLYPPELFGAGPVQSGEYEVSKGNYVFSNANISAEDLRKNKL